MPRCSPARCAPQSAPTSSSPSSKRGDTATSSDCPAACSTTRHEGESGRGCGEPKRFPASTFSGTVLSRGVRDRTRTWGSSVLAQGRRRARTRILRRRAGIRSASSRGKGGPSHSCRWDNAALACWARILHVIGAVKSSCIGHFEVARVVLRLSKVSTGCERNARSQATRGASKSLMRRTAKWARIARLELARQGRSGVIEMRWSTTIRVLTVSLLNDRVIIQIGDATLTLPPATASGLRERLERALMCADGAS